MSVEELLDTITCSVINNYYTAGIKTEVVIDTLITPVIRELIKEMLEKSGPKIIEGDLKYITKEFPMIKNKVDFYNDKRDYSHNKADYLLMDKNNIYLVELKTSMDSIEDGQIDFYDTYMQRMNKNPQILLAEFMTLFNSVSCTNIGDIAYRKKMGAYLNDSDKDKHNDISLKKLLYSVLGKDEIRKENAIEILKKNDRHSLKNLEDIGTYT